MFVAIFAYSFVVSTKYSYTIYIVKLGIVFYMHLLYIDLRRKLYAKIIRDTIREKFSLTLHVFTYILQNVGDKFVQIDFSE